MQTHGRYGAYYCIRTKLIARLVLRQKGKIYWPINLFKANKFCPFAVVHVPALQSIWFYNTPSDVWYEHFLTMRSGNNKPSSLIIRCVVSCIQSSYIALGYIQVLITYLFLGTKSPFHYIYTAMYL